MKERIRQLPLITGLSGRAFARKIGVSEGWMRTDNKEVRTDAVRKLINAFPDLNLNWLFKGEGEPFSYPNDEKSLNEHILAYKQSDISSNIIAYQKKLMQENENLRSNLIDSMKKIQDLTVENTQLKVKIELLNKS